VDGHKCLSAAHGVGPARWTGGCDGSIAIGVEVRLAHAKIVFQISNTFFLSNDIFGPTFRSL
jgi:hypothetical protein